MPSCKKSCGGVCGGGDDMWEFNVTVGTFCKRQVSRLNSGDDVIGAIFGEMYVCEVDTEGVAIY